METAILINEILLVRSATGGRKSQILPLRWNEVLVDYGHLRDIQGDKPHGTRVKAILELEKCEGVEETSSTYPAKQQAIVWKRHPWVSLTLRDFHRITGAKIHAQNICQKIEGHHSQPFDCCAFCSSGVPVVSVPGAPNAGWNLRDTRNMIVVNRS